MGVYYLTYQSSAASGSRIAAKLFVAPYQPSQDSQYGAMGWGVQP